MDTEQLLLAQCARYPLLETQDLCKALHQSVFGCGHFITDETAGLALLEREARRIAPSAAGDAEALGGSFSRVHLGLIPQTGLAPATLFRLFTRSAKAPRGDTRLLEESLAALQALAQQGQLPPAAADLDAVARWRQAGFPACHHSQRFRSAYSPAYRVISSAYVPLLPLLAAIDRTLAAQKRCLLAIEGGSAAGKTTLAHLLESLYDCAVFHMDDFFLRPEQRTTQRLAQPGEHVDHERFLSEVLTPLARGSAVSLRRYDCRSQTLLPAQTVMPRPLTVVEGAYSMHPSLSAHYDLSLFLDISPALQRSRILRRNTPAEAEQFFTRWIPLEQHYLQALQPARRCAFTLRADGGKDRFL